MGNVVSRAKLILGAVLLLNNVLDTLSKRLKSTPGIPVPNPSLPFWTVPRSPISSAGKALPRYVDIVIIGSGITGTSFAYHSLTRDSSLRILILEAREVCSGATGRNGGHINPPLFDDWEDNKEKYGEEAARMLVKFRLAHVKEMQRISRAEDVTEESQVRLTEHVEAYMDADAFQEAKDALSKWKQDMPDEAAPYHAYEGADATQKFGLADCVAGCVVGPGGAMHPYRFVTALQAKLLSRYSDNFYIATQTPCTSIEPSTSDSSAGLYIVTTPSGSVATRHIIHATNGWVSHLVAPMREKVVPARGTMSAQRPGTSLSASTRDGMRSFVFHPGGLGYDYLTQLPPGPSGGEGELMFGGGWASASPSMLTDIACADDTAFSLPVASHLAGALPLYFGSEHWGREKTAEGAPVRDGERTVSWALGRTKAQWGGILGISADGLPWVGRLPSKISGRAAPSPGLSDMAGAAASDKERARLAASKLAPPGEWISAGYTGEGMVHAWLCGKALSCMVLDAEDELRGWFPDILRITEGRWKKASFENFIAGKL